MNYPRTNYIMTEEDLKVILNACKPTPVMKIGSYTGSSPQENANRAWEALGKKMGFDYNTVRPPQVKERDSSLPFQVKQRSKGKSERNKKQRKQEL